MSYDVAATAARFANLSHVLRELVHRTAAQLEREPRFEIKALLADHLYDDARAAAKVQRRLARLGGGAPPGPELTQALDRGDVYGELKPSLIAAVAVHLGAIDPLLDEPGLRLLTQLLHRQERHLAELPAERTRVHDDLGASPPGATPRELTIVPALDRPARDAFIRPGTPDLGTPQGFAHALMNAKLLAAERAARSSHEQPGMPWDAHVDLARHCWDAVRHAEVLDRLMATALGCHWGDFPVDRELIEVRAEPAGGELGRVLEFFAADER